MNTGVKHQNPSTSTELVIPGHLARYAAEVEAWRLEAIAVRAGLPDGGERKR